jgi:hypothetical protein
MSATNITHIYKLSLIPLTMIYPWKFVITNFLEAQLFISVPTFFSTVPPEFQVDLFLRIHTRECSLFSSPYGTM